LSAAISRYGGGHYRQAQPQDIHDGYPAYHGAPSLGLLPLFDEQKGGLFIWIPTGLLMLVALLGTIDGWGRHESQQDDGRKRWTPSNSAILLYPTTGRALREMASVKNRNMAIGIAGFVLLVFGMAIGTVAVAHRVNRRENVRLYMLSRS
jgi:hypothetical protein